MAKLTESDEEVGWNNDDILMVIMTVIPDGTGGEERGATVLEMTGLL